MGFHLSVTEKAITKLKSLMYSDDSLARPLIRVGLKAGGCQGYSQLLELETSREDTDFYTRIDSLDFVVDQKSQVLLGSLTLDWKEDLLSKQFVFLTEKSKKSCGCGSSFSI